MINFQKTTLKNGLRIITAPMKETKAVTVLFLVGVGSRYEDKRLNGISHFLEHMFFKGTKKRPSTLDISKELDGIGAGYNAFTSDEETGFYVRAAAEHFDIALDILSDMLFSSKFAAEEIEREKGVILEEINMYKDTPQRYIFDLAKLLFFGNNSLGRSTAGEKTTVSKFIHNDFINYHDKFYNPNNMVVVVAGALNHFDWRKEIERKFAKIAKSEKSSYQKIQVQQNTPQISAHHKKTDQAYLAIGFHTFSRTDKRRPILQVLNNLLGETMSSRLFTEVRERRGLAYYIGSDTWDFMDNGAILAYAGVDLKRTNEAIKVILQEFERFKNHQVSAEDLKKAKENLKGRMYLGLEDSMSVAQFLANEEMFWPTIDQPEEIIEKIMKVQARDVQKLAEELFVASKLNFAIIGPYEKEEKFKNLINKF